MNIKAVLKFNGYILLFIALAMLLPVAVAFCYKESSGFAFFPAMGVCAVIAIPLMFIKTEKRDFFAREGLVTVALAWIIISIVGGLPFFFSKEIPSFLDCVFETASGFTTTGASILSNVEALSKCMLFWRSFTHWIGGMGVLMFVMAIAPLAGNNNMQLIRAESSGPKIEKIKPKANTTAKVLYGMYIGLTCLQIICMLLGGMPFFDAVTIAFGTAGTGGFGIRNTSVAEYSTYIQAVITVFLFLFSVNFNIYFLLLARKFKAVFKNEELRWFVGIVLSAIILITLNNFKLFENFGNALHHTSFTVLSLVSTAGFSTVDFDLWPEFSKGILLVLMFVGACAGSTGGGIKVSRILIMLKVLKREFSTQIHPKSVKMISVNGKRIDDETVKRVNAYLVCYILIFIASFIIVSLDHFNFETNFTAIAAMMNNIGPGLAAVGPTQNFSGFSNLSKIVFIIDMICGRLELFPIMILLLPQTWKKY